MNIQQRKIEIEKQIMSRHLPAIKGRVWDIRRACDDLLTEIERAETGGLKRFSAHQSSAFVDGYPARDAAQITNRLGQIAALMEELEYLTWEEQDSKEQ